MIEVFNEFIQNSYVMDKNMYGLMNLGIVAGMGVTLGLVTEVVLRLLGVKDGAH